jgi:hypothetical protein
MDLPDRPDRPHPSGSVDSPSDLSHPDGATTQSPSAAQGAPSPPPEPPNPVHPTRGPNEIALGGVLLAVLVGLALVGQDHWRRGLLLAGIGLLAGAAVRLVLPARLVGLLAVRGRVFDAVVLAVLGTALIVLTSSVPLPPGSG